MCGIGFGSIDGALLGFLKWRNGCAGKRENDGEIYMRFDVDNMRAVNR